MDMPQKPPMAAHAPAPTPGAPGMAPQGMPQQAMPQPQQQPMVNGEELQGLLFSRIGQMSDEELDVLQSIITPETASVLFKLLPELGILIEKALQGSEEGMGSMPEKEGGSDTSMEHESDNPLVNPKISSGLMRR